MSLAQHTFDAFMYPVSGLPPWTGVVHVALLFSVLTAAGCLLLYRNYSRFSGGGKIAAGILEVFLYRHDMMLQWRALGRVFMGALCHAAAFALLMAAYSPLIMLYSPQAQAWLAHRPVHPGEFIYLSVTQLPDSGPLPTLVPPESVEQDPVRVHMPEERASQWRLRMSPEAACGSHPVVVHLHGFGSASIPVRVGKDVLSRIQGESRFGVMNNQRPSEPALAAATVPIPRIQLRYPVRGYRVGSREVSWSTLFILVVFVSSPLLVFISRGLKWS